MVMFGYFSYICNIFYFRKRGSGNKCDKITLFVNGYISFHSVFFKFSDEYLEYAYVI